MRAVPLPGSAPLLSVMSEDSVDLLDRCVGFLGRDRSGLPNSPWARDAVVVERFATHLVNGGMLTVMTRICRDEEPAVRFGDQPAEAAISAPI
ncbi:hypothetical protein [Nocardia sp. NRRL S-836]|uniref:hypothetical protein n=1 Tax=Nocardia sp. NRRL S-836 TaxID=1519492 RepID=UPI0018D09CE0|nr:hypothetical protein [Nocardia sp. NRRL S-836]